MAASQFGVQGENVGGSVCVEWTKISLISQFTSNGAKSYSKSSGLLAILLIVFLLPITPVYPADPPAIFDGKETAKKAQASWAKHLQLSVEIRSSIGTRLELIPPGRFMMGEAKGGVDESPAHEVVITKPFYLAKHEVTQGEWTAVMDSSPWNERDVGRIRNGNDLPVTHIRWEEAVEFCNRLSKKEGKAYMLPTEAEWEYACRAGTKSRWYFGNNAKGLAIHALFDAKPSMEARMQRYQSDITSVGQRKPNPFGLCDMYGNVREYCSDWYDSASYKEEEVEDPKGPNAGEQLTVVILGTGKKGTFTSHVTRGGCYNSSALQCRSAARGTVQSEGLDRVTGFRLKYSPNP